jgi:hypothetical protein
MSERDDHEKLADELEGEAREMEERTDELGERIDDVREDWKRKRSDDAVPGAIPPREASDRDQPGDEVNLEDADRQPHEHEDPGAREDPGEDEQR